MLECLGPDTSAIVFTLLHHPVDLARASAVSRSWRTFGLLRFNPDLSSIYFCACRLNSIFAVIANRLRKMMCLRGSYLLNSYSEAWALLQEISRCGLH
jgi:hypothetical protein